MLADTRSFALLALALLALVLADARSLAFLACTPPAPVLADARSSALLALAPFALVGAHACHALLFFLALAWLLPHCSLTNMRLQARRFQITCLHKATREGRHRRLQLLSPSMHRVTTAAHILGTRLVLALSLHVFINSLWPCSFPRRFGPALCTLPLEYFHQDQVYAATARSTPPSGVSRFEPSFLHPLLQAQLQQTCRVRPGSRRDRSLATCRAL